jgi:uncharacterized membrane protein
MSRPPEHPGEPHEPWGQNPNPGYPPPPAGPPSGYPPPPPPPPPPGPPTGYGQPHGHGTLPPPPGYPPATGYAAPGYPSTSHFDVGNAFRWAWNKFTKYPAELIVPFIGYAAVMSVLAILIWVVGGGAALLGGMAGSDDNTYSGAASAGSGAASAGLGIGSIFVFFVGYLALLAAGAYFQAAYVSGCLDIADGRPVTIGSFFHARNFGPVILTTLLVGIGTAIGAILCVIPGIIFGFLAQWAVLFVIDRGLAPVEAVKASIAAVRSNIGGALLAYLAQMVAVFAGELACGIGVLVGMPVAILIQVYSYRFISGGQVAPIAA